MNAPAIEQAPRDKALPRSSAVFTEGNLVRCVAPSIDHKIGQGEVGKITGFARFSSYHAREAMVQFDDGRSDWFWTRDLEWVA